MADGCTFVLRVDGGSEQMFASRHTTYIHAAMEAFGCLGLPYPCSIEIWVPDLVDAGYGPYHYRIDDFVDGHGNIYGCPAVMHARAPAVQPA